VTPERVYQVELEDGTLLRAVCSCRGQVRRTKTMTQTIIVCYPAGHPLCVGAEYECATCGAAMESEP
jgi:hypothetical protein